MPGEKHPIIAHGELYVEPIVKKSRPIDKSIPHEYEDAKQRLLSDIFGKDLDLKSKSAVLIDGNTGRILFRRENLVCSHGAEV